MRTIDQAVGGKLRDKNAKESWALLEDHALYDNESWKDPGDFAKQMEAHLAPKPPIQVNKITSSCEICSGPHDTQYCMEIPEQAFVDYASSRIDEAGGKWYTFKPEQNNLGLVFKFMASQDARLSKFESDFKQQQCEITNKIDTVLKAINDRITGALPSDTVKNPKLNVNSTFPVLFARSCPAKDPQCSSHPLNSINAIKVCFKEATYSQKDQLQRVNEIGTQQTKEPEQTLEDEFKELHLNLHVLEVLAHDPMYNAILDKYVESLKLGKNGSAFIQGKTPERMKDPGLFTLPCKLGDSKPFDTLADLGSYMEEDPATPLLVAIEFLATANAVIDCKKAKITENESLIHHDLVRMELVPEPLTNAKKDFIDGHLPGEWKMDGDVELNPFKDVPVFRRMVEFLGALPINLKGNM
ncbi:hypothetical protein Tco_1156870 [Tanacetum coccineum]